MPEQSETNRHGYPRLYRRQQGLDARLGPSDETLASYRPLYGLANEKQDEVLSKPVPKSVFCPSDTWRINWNDQGVRWYSYAHNYYANSSCAAYTEKRLFVLKRISGPRNISRIFILADGYAPNRNYATIGTNNWPFAINASLESMRISFHHNGSANWLFYDGHVASKVPGQCYAVYNMIDDR